MNMKEYAFGIDLGGTTAKVGLFTTAGALLEKWEVATDTSNAGEHILGNLAKAVKDKMQENGITAEQVEGVGVGVPGPVLDSRIVPIVCANLGGWGERNVSIQLSGLLDGMKVLVGNDADVAALGEIWMGCAKGCRSTVMVTLGTGVGGGVIVNGRIIEGAHGAGGEIGHISLDPQGPPCACGKRGCLERLVSATSLHARLQCSDERMRASILREAGTYLGTALSIPVGLLDLADVCVYGQSDIVNDTLLSAAQAQLDLLTGSSFHTRTIIRRCECEGEITLRGEALSVLHDYLENR